MDHNGRSVVRMNYTFDVIEFRAYDHLQPGKNIYIKSVDERVFASEFSDRISSRWIVISLFTAPLIRIHPVIRVFREQSGSMML